MWRFTVPILLPLALAAACAGIPAGDSSRPPILFIHGSQGDASRWTATIWRFESNGWPRDRLFAMDVVHPRPRTDDAVPQAGRTSGAEHAAQVAAEVERIRRLTGADKVVLVASSRGGLAARDYVRNGGGARIVSHVVMGGTPNHGVLNTKDFLAGSEVNNVSPYMTALNSPQGPDGLEVTPGVAFMTLRSDNLDLFTQPDARALGQPKVKTNVTHDGPALKGAENIVIPGADHLEVALGRDAFVHTYRFITGTAPTQLEIVPERSIVLDGTVTGMSADGTPSNLPIGGARVEVFEVSPQSGERRGGPVHDKVVGGDGRWGPFAGNPGAYHEFVVTAEGYATTHFYRSPFPRSSSVVHLRPARMGDSDRKAQSVVTLHRPRGFLAAGRDRMSLDGKPPPGIASGVPGVNVSTIRLDEPAMRSLVAEVNGERIVVRTWPVKENRLVRAEFHY